MLMEQERIYTEATISKSIINDEWETDANGNPVVIIEASNENLDYQEEQVMKLALMDSKDYFLKNGKISYDHKHIPSPDNYKWDPEWNPEKYIIGKPLEAWEGIGQGGKPTVFVKAVLSRSNAIAKEIIGKLKDKIGTVFASVGGRRVKKAMKFDPKTYKEIPTIIGVDWDEVALTHKPVNQTLGSVILSPKEFVKSLTAGSSANPAEMTGGNTLQMQSSERNTIKTLIHKLRSKEITKSNDAINHLVNSGVSEEKARDILKMLINNFLGDVIMAEENAAEVVDTSTDELLKALENLGDGGDMSKSDGEYIRKGGFMYKKGADGKYESEDKDAPAYEEKEEKGVEKALTPDPVEPDEFGYDATVDVMEMKKDITILKAQNVELRDLVKSIIDETEKQTVVMKSMGKVAVEDSVLLKSIADTPQPRVTKVGNLQITERFEKSQVEKLQKVTSGSLMKSMMDNNVTGEKRAIANLAFRRGGVAALDPEIADLLVKE